MAEKNLCAQTLLMAFIFGSSSFLFCSLQPSMAEADVDIRLALTNFSKALDPPQTVLQTWNADVDPCVGTWKGITCKDGSHVTHVILQALQLNGTLDATSLCQVDTLRVLSLETNNLVGPIPANISRCEDIRRIYLGSNRFSGNVPEGMTGLKRLEVLDLSRNDLSGRLPPFNVAAFKTFEVTGNAGLCGDAPNIPPCGTQQPSPRRRNDVAHLIAMWAGYIALFIVLVFIFAFVFLHRKKYLTKLEAKVERVKQAWSRSGGSMPGKEKNSLEITTSSSSELAVSMMDAKSTSLVFLDGSRRALRFEELLRSSAELLGRGGLGSLYRVVLYDGGVESALVVKRIKDVRIPRYEFEKRMVEMGRLKHANVLPLVAYYCSKEEKLLVYDYMKNGSISSLLHGHFEDKKLDWQTRLGVASGVAHGLAYLHDQCPNTPQGNIKSSNVVLNSKYQPCITEYGLSFLLDNPALAQDALPGQWGGYKAPEYSQTKRLTQKSDVYSFGVVLLELLTGKAVESSGLDLPRWVHSVVREEWTVEVFDKSIVGDVSHSSEDRMVALLRIAVNCVANLPAERPAMVQVAKLIDKLKDEEDRSIEQSYVTYSYSTSTSCISGNTTPVRTDISQ